MPAIELQDIWKHFRINRKARPSLLQLIRGLGHSGVRDLPVLRGITLTIDHGDKIGLVGRNGAGKTTLMRLINGIYKPDRGIISVSGRLAAILQLGVGLIGILSVKDNIFLYGAVLGLSREAIRKRYRDVLRFADLEDFETAEVRQLSTGMRQRLAFAVAAQVHADVLLLDEVLAVGDQVFRNKCYDYLNDRLAGNMTVLFASHDLASIEEYFPKTIWLEDGRVAAYDSTPEVLKSYKRKYGSSVEDRLHKRGR
jgi:ABC-type polysaccharide/polyol phosphate transport system ATPase subunit